jgi:hypothetical protein
MKMMKHRIVMIMTTPGMTIIPAALTAVIILPVVAGNERLAIDLVVRVIKSIKEVARGKGRVHMSPLLLHVYNMIKHTLACM